MYGSSLSLRQVLRRSRLFARLGDSEIDAILAHATVSRETEGAQIFAKGLVRLAEENGHGESSAKPVGVKISQRALGELVGGSRESVNKHLQDWKRSGIIAIEKGSIMIQDVEALAAFT